MNMTPAQRQLALAGLSLVFGAAMLLAVPQTVRADGCGGPCVDDGGLDGSCAVGEDHMGCYCYVAVGNEPTGSCD
jgi:hypothetical protein